jgi:hypothetical protein
MDEKSRQWFDDVYSLMEGLPSFAIFTNKVRYEHVEELFKNYKVTVAKDEIKHFEEIFDILYKHLPPEQDFIEEKARIMSVLTPKLKEKIGWVETAVSFGKFRGDIDLCLISPYEIQTEKLFEALPRKDPILSEYPIVDWDTLLYFQCKNGQEFADKIIKSAQDEKYCPERIKQNLCSAKLMWGNEKEIDLMKSRLEQFLQSGHTF